MHDGYDMRVVRGSLMSIRRDGSKQLYEAVPQAVLLGTHKLFLR